MRNNQIIVSPPYPFGFHTRPCFIIASIVNHYGGDVILLVGKDQFDASDATELQWAGAMIKRCGIETVVFQGNPKAIKDLKILSQANYGEDSMGEGKPLPTKLHYLKMRRL